MTSDDINLDDCEEFTDHGDGTYTVRLTEPVKRGGELMTEIRSIKPTVKEMMMTDQYEGTVGKTVALVAALFNVGVNVIQRIGWYDYQVLKAVVERAMGKRRVTGES